MAHNKRKPSRPAQASPKKRKSLRKPVSTSDDDEGVDIQKIHTDIKKLYRKAQQTRYKRLGRYKSDRWIWNGAFLLIMFWLWFIAHSYHYDLDSFICNPDQGYYEGFRGVPGQSCENPFYKPQDAWKCQPELPTGEYGQKLGPLFHTAWMVVLGILLLAGIINHITHNRRYRR